MIYKQGFWDADPPEGQTVTTVEDAIPIAIEGARAANAERGYIMVGEPESVSVVRENWPDWPAGHFMIRVDVGGRRRMTPEELAARPPAKRPKPPPTPLQVVQARLDDLAAEVADLKAQKGKP